MIYKKLILAGIILVLTLPMVMAVEYTEALNLWYLLVENVFGNLLLTYFGITAFFVFIAAISKMSKMSIWIFLIIWTMTFGIGWVGALASVPVFIFTFIYFIFALFNWFSSAT